MKDPNDLLIMDQTIEKLKKENRALKLEIKKVHINNEFFEEELRQIKSVVLFKVWQFFKPFIKKIFLQNIK